MHNKEIVYKGKDIAEAEKALIMLHGRGADAGDILTLADYLKLDDYALVAPQARGRSWYPSSFLSPVKLNEPWLSSALELIYEIVEDLVQRNIKAEQIYFLGFSQGACLTLEFAARNARRYGGVAAFTGGLIGDRIYEANYRGDFNKTPIFIGSGDPDLHVPVERVHESAEILKNMNADLTVKIYKDMGHTVSPDEIRQAQTLIFNS